MDGAGYTRIEWLDSSVRDVTGGGETTYVVTADEDLIGLHESDDGRFATTCSCLGDGASRADVAAATNGCVALGGGQRTAVAGYAPDGTERWRTDARFDADATVAMTDGIAFDASSGEELSLDVPDDPTVVVPTDRGGAYVVAGGTVYAVDAAAGRVTWRFPERTDWPFGGPTVTGLPVPAGDGVLVSTERKTHELDATDGRVRWRRAFPEDRVIGAAGEVVVLPNDEGRVVGRRRR